MANFLDKTGLSYFYGKLKDVFATKSSVPTESTVSGWGFTKNTGTYSKPSTGIPKTDLASAVQTSLGKADSALQSYTETDPVFSASAAAGIKSTDITNWNGKTSNTGTVTSVSVKMNNASKGTVTTSGTIDLGTVITAHQDISGKQDKLTSSNKLSSSLVSGLATVATSGSYNDLSNKPTIPTVNNATLTIQKNGTNVQTFTANQSSNATANITVPTKTSDLTNDSGFLTGITKSQVTTALGYTPPTSDTNTTYTFAEGSTNGAFSVTPSGGTATSVKVHGVLTSHQDISGKANTSIVPSVVYCTCSTAAATAAKVVTVASSTRFNLEKGTVIAVKFTTSNSASNVTLNVNSTGAKSIYYNNAAYTSNSTAICGYANRHTYYVYDGTYWVWINYGTLDGNTYPSAHCTTAAGTAAKTASCSNYYYLAKSYIHIIIGTTNTAASALTMNINSQGAKPIYLNGSATSASNYNLTRGSYLAYYDGTNIHMRTDGKIPNLATVASTGSYSDLTNKPTIPNVTDIIKLVFPVGSIYSTYTNTNPNTLLGFGTWESLATSMVTSVTENVMGNGKAMGLYDGTECSGLMGAWTGGGNALVAVPWRYGYNAGGADTNGYTMANWKLYGLPTKEKLGDTPANSGLIVERSSVTIYHWRRTA